MAYVTREQIAEALFALLSSAAPFKTKSRRFVMWDALSSAQKPALVFREPNEQHRNDDGPEPAVRFLYYEVFIYLATGLDPKTVPSVELNKLIDAIDPNSGGVLMPNLMTGRQTLGGLVYDCRVDGEIMKEPGDLNGQGVALIPIRVTVP